MGRGREGEGWRGQGQELMKGKRMRDRYGEILSRGKEQREVETGKWGIGKDEDRHRAEYVLHSVKEVASMCGQMMRRKEANFSQSFAPALFWSHHECSSLSSSAPLCPPSHLGMASLSATTPRWICGCPPCGPHSLICPHSMASYRPMRSCHLSSSPICLDYL